MKRGLRRAMALVTAVLLVYALALGSAYYFTLAPLDLRAMLPSLVAAMGPDGTAKGEKEGAERPSILEQMDRIACEESARFAIEHMLKVPIFSGRFTLFDHCLKSLDPEKDGLYCEFGVWEGTTINALASKTAHEIHGFDSFEGLPEDWRSGYGKGTFGVARLPKVLPNVKLHKGWFDASLPAWMKDHPGPVAFLHMDADLYSSTKTVLDLLAERIVPGTVIQFDEYFNYPGWQGGEHKAFTEFVEAHRVKFEYLGYCESGAQVAVRIVAVGRPKSE